MSVTKRLEGGSGRGEIIHCGHFMVSDLGKDCVAHTDHDVVTAISIDEASLTKLFQCMTIAYRPKITTPKWNKFKSASLRCKDKIRLNNVIWRCWHMKFILNKKKTMCQFASPVEADENHSMPEAAAILEGRYSKRKMSTIVAEYQKWRLFHRNRIMGLVRITTQPVSPEGVVWNRRGTGISGVGDLSNILDEEMFLDFSDSLFSSFSSNVPFVFPNPREITSRGMVADFIQPGLIQLQPDLDDFMDTFDALRNDYEHSKLLTPVPEELELSPASTSIDRLATTNTCYQLPQGFPPLSRINNISFGKDAQGGNNNRDDDVFVKPYGRPLRKPTSHHFQNQQLQNGLPHAFFDKFNEGPKAQPMSGSYQHPTPISCLTRAVTNVSMASSSKVNMNRNYTAFEQPFQLAAANNTPLHTNYGNVETTGITTSMPQMLHQQTATFVQNGGTMSSSSLPGMLPVSDASRSHPISSPPNKMTGSEHHKKHHPRHRYTDVEKKRRGNIKNSFDVLSNLMSHLSNQHTNGHISKAVMLTKVAENIRERQRERATLEEEIAAHKAQVQELNRAISNLQCHLPDHGVSVRTQNFQMKEMFNAWCRERTMENWKFWLFSKLIRPLLDSYNGAVSTGSVDELCRTVLAWVNQDCSLANLRPAVLDSLLKFCTTTDFLSNPAGLKKEAHNALNSVHDDSGEQVRGQNSRTMSQKIG